MMHVHILQTSAPLPMLAAHKTCSCTSVNSAQGKHIDALMEGKTVSTDKGSKQHEQTQIFGVSKILMDRKTETIACITPLSLLNAKKKKTHGRQASSEKGQELGNHTPSQKLVSQLKR